MSKPCLHLVIGGVRSGKSEFAENWILKKHKESNETNLPLYIATAVNDGSMQERIQLHKERRLQTFKTLEKNINLSDLPVKDKHILIECVPLWLNNYFTVTNYQMKDALNMLIKDFNLLLTNKASIIVMVTGEVGLGIHAESKISREYADALGSFNQLAAQEADIVTMMIAGIPVTIKSDSI